MSEFKHNVGANYLIASVSWLVLLQLALWVDRGDVTYAALWWAFAAPLIALDLKVYVQLLNQRLGTRLAQYEAIHERLKTTEARKQALQLKVLILY